MRAQQHEAAGQERANSFSANSVFSTAAIFFKISTAKNQLPFCACEGKYFWFVTAAGGGVGILPASIMVGSGPIFMTTFSKTGKTVSNADTISKPISMQTTPRL